MISFRKLIAPYYGRKSLLNYVSLLGNSSQSNSEDLKSYLRATDQTLEDLSDKLESVLEKTDVSSSSSDVRLESGVLTVQVNEDNIYVINRQTPNRQIWLSSPLSGPRRFDLVDGQWIDRTSEMELRKLLSKEFTDLLKIKIEDL